ncbi:MAG: hypothetical protein RLY31_1755 [Bacteroidota bacterium]|jgi:carboxyl-terminal processing protease
MISIATAKAFVMKNRGILLLLTAAAASLLAFYPPTGFTQKESAVVQSLMAGLNYHYKPQEINDDLSSRLYHLYLDRLDGERRWLTRQDIDALAAQELSLDDQLNSGSFEFLDLAIARQSAGIEKTKAWFQEILEEPFDFSKKEKFESDGKKRPYAKDDAELREHWRKAMKFETLSRLNDKLNRKEKGEEEFKDKTIEELEQSAREELLKSYNDWYGRLEKRKRTDHLSLFLNCFTNLYDPHTEYYEPIDKQNFDIGMSGRLEGIGARLQTDGDFTKVNEIIVGGPVWKQGILQKNDRIVKVAQENETEWTDITGMLINDVVQLIRGKPGSKVRLTVKKASDGSIQEIEVVRDVVIIEEGFAKSLILESPQRDRIGYIRLPKFYADFQNENGRRCADDIAVELEKLRQEQVDGIILDLRSNGGGSLSDVVEMSGFFIEKGPVVQVKSRGRQPEVLSDKDPTVQYNGPLVVMVNQFSASASEILAAALQDYGRAVIVGTGSSTFGKGTVQRFFDLDNIIRGNQELKPLGQVKLTVQKFFRVNGGSTQLRGVTPDIVLPDTWMYLETGEKEEDFPMEWTQIEPVSYGQSVYQLPFLDKIREASRGRVQNDETFRQIEQRAKDIRRKRDDSVIELQLDRYRKEMADWKAEDDAFDKLFEKEVVVSVSNPVEDLPAIQQDESKKARNDEWLADVRKDLYLLETLRILHDMLVLQ